MTTGRPPPLLRQARLSAPVPFGPFQELLWLLGRASYHFQLVVRSVHIARLLHAQAEYLLCRFQTVSPAVWEAVLRGWMPRPCFVAGSGRGLRPQVDTTRTIYKQQTIPPNIVQPHVVVAKVEATTPPHKVIKTKSDTETSGPQKDRDRDRDGDRGQGRDQGVQVCFKPKSKSKSKSKSKHKSKHKSKSKFKSKFKEQLQEFRDQLQDQDQDQETETKTKATKSKLTSKTLAPDQHQNQGQDLVPALVQVQDQVQDQDLDLARVQAQAQVEAQGLGAQDRDCGRDGESLARNTIDEWLRHLNQDRVIGEPLHTMLQFLHRALSRSKMEHPLPTLDDPNYRGPAW